MPIGCRRTPRYWHRRPRLRTASYIPTWTCVEYAVRGLTHIGEGLFSGPAVDANADPGKERPFEPPRHSARRRSGGLSSAPPPRREVIGFAQARFDAARISGTPLRVAGSCRRKWRHRFSLGCGCGNRSHTSRITSSTMSSPNTATAFPRNSLVVVDRILRVLTEIRRCADCEEPFVSR